jgi:hypothetical protein
MLPDFTRGLGRDTEPIATDEMGRQERLQCRRQLQCLQLPEFVEFVEDTVETNAAWIAFQHTKGGLADQGQDLCRLLLRGCPRSRHQ